MKKEQKNEKRAKKKKKWTDWRIGSRKKEKWNLSFLIPGRSLNRVTSKVFTKSETRNRVNTSIYLLQEFYLLHLQDTQLESLLDDDITEAQGRKFNHRFGEHLLQVSWRVKCSSSIHTQWRTYIFLVLKPELLWCHLHKG